MFLELVIDELVEMFEKGVKDVWDEYKNNMSRSRQYLSLQSSTCQGKVASLERRQKAILDVSSAWTTPMRYVYQRTQRLFIWDTVGSYLRITLTIGIEKIWTGLLRNAYLQNIKMGLRYFEKSTNWMLSLGRGTM